jgi:NADH dehydrogenase
MPERLREAAVKTLWRKWIEVRFNAVVADYDGALVRLKSGELIPAQTVIWAAGVQASSLNSRLGIGTARQGRVPVAPTLQLAGHDEVFMMRRFSNSRERRCRRLRRSRFRWGNTRPATS